MNHNLILDLQPIYTSEASVLSAAQWFNIQQEYNMNP